MIKLSFSKSKFISDTGGKANSLKFQPESQTDGRIATTSKNRHVGPNQHVDILKRPHDVSHKVVS